MSVIELRGGLEDLFIEYFGPVKLLLDMKNHGKIKKGLCCPFRVPKAFKDRQCLFKYTFSILKIGLLELDATQLQQPLPLQELKRPLFVFFLLFFLPLIRLKRGLGPVTGSAGVVRG